MRRLPHPSAGMRHRGHGRQPSSRQPSKARGRRKNGLGPVRAHLEAPSHGEDEEANRASQWLRHEFATEGSCRNPFQACVKHVQWRARGRSVGLKENATRKGEARCVMTPRDPGVHVLHLCNGCPRSVATERKRGVRGNYFVRSKIVPLGGVAPTPRSPAGGLRNAVG